MRRAVLLCAIAATTALPARAEPSQVLGEGMATCGEFLNQPALQSARVEWVLGYISGRNSEAHEQHNRMAGRSINDAQGPVLWLQNYCHANPPAPLILAGDKLRAALQIDER